MNAVAAWLCEANKGGSDEGYAAVTKRALKWRAGYGRPEDPDWVSNASGFFLFYALFRIREGRSQLTSSHRTFPSSLPFSVALYFVRRSSADGDVCFPLQFLSMRKTLEANMVMADLFPPGRVLWAIRDSDLEPCHRLSANTGTSGSSSHSEDKVRLFDVLDVEKMFGQIIFARDMLR